MPRTAVSLQLKLVNESLKGMLWRDSGLEFDLTWTEYWVGNIVRVSYQMNDNF